MNQLVIYQGSGLGDVVSALPTLHALKEADPGGTVTFACAPKYARFLERVPDIDYILADDGRMSRRRRQTLAAQHGRVVELCPSVCEGEYEQGLSRVELFARAAGAELLDMAPVYPVTDALRAEAARLLERAGRPLVAIGPETGQACRRVPVKLWRRVIAEISPQAGVVIVATRRIEGLGSRVRGERDSRTLKPEPCLGRSVAFAAAALEYCDCVVCADTGLYHLAAAVGTPALGLFGPTSGAVISRPYPLAHWMAPAGFEACMPCYFREDRGYGAGANIKCPAGGRCLAAIPAGQIAGRALAIARDAPTQASKRQRNSDVGSRVSGLGSSPACVGQTPAPSPSTLLAIEIADPTVAVIVAVHGEYVGYLGECLSSIAAQTHRPTEFIVAYNGRSQKTEDRRENIHPAPPRRDNILTPDSCLLGAEAAARAVAQNHHALFLSFDDPPDPAKRGVCAMLNAAARATVAEYLLFVDADNTLSPGYIEAMLARMADPRVGFTYPTIRYTGQRQGIARQHAIPFDPGRLTFYNYIEGCSLVRRDAFEAAGGFDAGTGGMRDWILWLRLADLGWRGTYCPGAELAYRVHAGNLRSPARSEPMQEASFIAGCRRVAVFTPFCGRSWAVDRYFDFLSRLEWDHGLIHLVFYDNSADPDFADILKDYLRGCDYGATTYFTDVERIAPALDPGLGASELSNAQVADFGKDGRIRSHEPMGRTTSRIYNRMLALLSEPLVWIIEDDVEPPPDALARLVHALWPRERAFASGLVMSRFHGTPFAARATDWARGEFAGLTPAPGVRPVDATGFGCILLRRAALADIVFRPILGDVRRIYRQSTDYSMCRDLARLGYKGVIDWDCVCKHWNQDGSWV